MKKAIKKSKTSKGSTSYSSQEMKHYLGALNEIHGENLKGIRKGFSILNRKFDSQAEMVGTLMEDMVIVKEDLSIIKGGLKKKVDYDDFLSLVRRVQKIESKI